MFLETFTLKSYEVLSSPFFAKNVTTQQGNNSDIFQILWAASGLTDNQFVKSATVEIKFKMHCTVQPTETVQKSLKAYIF